MLTEEETKKRFDDPGVRAIARANALRIFEGQRLKFFAELTAEQAAMISRCQAMQYVYDATVLNMAAQAVIHHQEICRLEVLVAELKKDLAAERCKKTIPDGM